MRFQVLTAASLNVSVFCHVALCSLVEVSTGLRLARGPRPGSTDNVRVRARFGLNPNDSRQSLHRTFRAISDRSFLSKKKFLVALISCS